MQDALIVLQSSQSRTDRFGFPVKPEMFLHLKSAAYQIHVVHQWIEVAVVY